MWSDFEFSEPYSGEFALTIMIAESKPEEMEMMITVIMNCMK